MKNLLWLALYALAVALPLIVVAATEEEQGEEQFLRELGDGAALIALGILLMQPVLAARLRPLDRAFGLDAVYRFHRSMGVVAGCLLVAHPVLIAAGRNAWFLLTSFSLPWHILLAKTGAAVVVALVLSSLFYGALRLRFETWRALHNALALSLVSIGLVHSGFTARLFERPATLGAWVVLGAAALVVWTAHRIVRPARLKVRSWTVVEATPETHNVWTLKLEPAPGTVIPDYLPGQFHFLTLRRHAGPVEEHPFTISSSPTEKRFVTSTIKASGDFTATVGDTKPGDAASREGAYGRFSCALHPEEKDLVFIAGGIGITPFMSMLRWMRDTSADARVRLIFGNRAERDIVFRDELDAMAKAARPTLSIIHVLSEPDASWAGEKGYVDEEKITRLVGGDLSGKTFYLCGPPVMMKKLTATLRKLGVPKDRIRSERFAL